MSTSKASNVADGRKGGSSGVEGLTDVMDEMVSAQILQGIARIENRLASMEDRFGGRLDEIEARLSSGRGVAKKVVTEKVPVRNVILSMMQKGWVSETDIIAKTGELGTAWQTIGVRSLVTKLRGLGVAVETEERDGVPYYRTAR